MKKIIVVAFIYGVAIIPHLPGQTLPTFTATWYKYNGPWPQSTVSRENPNNYLKILSDPMCVGSTNECAVEMSSDNGPHPNFGGTTFDSLRFPQVDAVNVLANELCD